MSNVKKTKNDICWEQIFSDLSIAKKVKQSGTFEITADQIKSYHREPRLMTKFDQSSNLPKIFRDHDLSILPITRGRYVIGNFNTYEVLTKPEKRGKPTKINFPSTIQTIDFKDIYSESIALNCASICGMIDKIINEKAELTVSGRMSTSTFDFNIHDLSKVTKHHLSVENSQCEIDGGYESSNNFIIIEAKNFFPDDFIIRQLYYPYRLWASKINKRIVPVLMLYSNDIFSFYVFQFQDIADYNSITLTGEYHFKLYEEEIDRIDILNLLKTTKTIAEPKIPFPQADSFERIIDLLGLLMEKELSYDEITENYNFTTRQTDYYSNAGRYLGLIKKENIDGNIGYTLTAKTRRIMSKPYKEKYLAIITSILEHKVFYDCLEKRFLKKTTLTHEEIVKIMKNNVIYGVKSENTYYRRAQTIRSWIEWVFSFVSS
jgi:hypothetical protein